MHLQSLSQYNFQCEQSNFEINHFRSSVLQYRTHSVLSPFTLEIYISKFPFEILVHFRNKNFWCEMGLRVVTSCIRYRTVRKSISDACLINDLRNEINRLNFLSLPALNATGSDVLMCDFVFRSQTWNGEAEEWHLGRQRRSFVNSAKKLASDLSNTSTLQSSMPCYLPVASLCWWLLPRI